MSLTLRIPLPSLRLVPRGHAARGDRRGGRYCRRGGRARRRDLRLLRPFRRAARLRLRRVPVLQQLLRPPQAQRGQRRQELLLGLGPVVPDIRAVVQPGRHGRRLRCAAVRAHAAAVAAAAAASVRSRAQFAHGQVGHECAARLRTEVRVPAGGAAREKGRCRVAAGAGGRMCVVCDRVCCVDWCRCRVCARALMCEIGRERRRTRREEEDARGGRGRSATALRAQRSALRRAGRERAPRVSEAGEGSGAKAPLLRAMPRARRPL